MVRERKQGYQERKAARQAEYDAWKKLQEEEEAKRDRGRRAPAPAPAPARARVRAPPPPAPPLAAPAPVDPRAASGRGAAGAYPRAVPMGFPARGRRRRLTAVCGCAAPARRKYICTNLIAFVKKNMPKQAEEKKEEVVVEHPDGRTPFKKGDPQDEDMFAGTIAPAPAPPPAAPAPAARRRPPRRHPPRPRRRAPPPAAPPARRAARPPARAPAPPAAPPAAPRACTAAP